MKVLEQALTVVLMSMNVLQILITARMKLIVQTPEGDLLAIVKLDSVEMGTNVQASQFCVYLKIFRQLSGLCIPTASDSDSDPSLCFSRRTPLGTEFTVY